MSSVPAREVNAGDCESPHEQPLVSYTQAKTQKIYEGKIFSFLHLLGMQSHKPLAYVCLFFARWTGEL